MKRNTKIVLGVGGGLAALAGGYFLWRKMRTTTAGDGMGADEYGEGGGAGSSFMLTACLPQGHACDPALGNSQCCDYWNTPDGEDGYRPYCGGPSKAMDQPPFLCRKRYSSKGSVIGEGPAVGPGQEYGAGGNVKLIVKSPRYLMTWYDKQGHGTISDLDINQGEDLIDAVVAMGGGEADIPRCIKYPNMRFALYPMDPDLYSSSAAYSAMLNARNHGYKDYLEEHAFKYAEIEGGPAQKYVTFKDLWPGPYWVYELDHRNKSFSTVKIGVENFEQGLGNVLGNMFATMKSYLGGDMDWSQITVKRSCNFYPWYITVDPGQGRMGSTATFTYQPYYHYAFHEGNVSDTFEWLQDAFNDMGEYISDKIDQIAGDEFGI